MSSHLTRRSRGTSQKDAPLLNLLVTSQNGKKFLQLKNE
jgi:hypothetical protein